MSISRDRTSDLIGIVQLLKFSGFSLYPLYFFLYSPFKSRYVNSANSRQVYLVYSLFKIAILKNIKVILLKNII